MPQTSRVHELHSLHSQKLAKLEAKREEINKQEQAHIEEGREAWKKNKKVAWEPTELNALDASQRLYNDHRRRAECVRDIVREEEYRLWCEAHPKTNRSRNHSDTPLRSAREACARLHMDSVRRNQEFQTKVAAGVSRDLAEFNKEPKVASSVRFVELWEDATNRQKRQKEQNEAKRKAEEAPLLKPDTRPVDMKRIEDLHNMHLKRKQRRDRINEERKMREIEEIAALSSTKKRALTPRCHAQKKAVKLGIVVTAHLKNIDYHLLDDLAHEALVAEMKYAIRKQIVAAVGRGKIAQEDVDLEFASSSVEAKGCSPRSSPKSCGRGGCELRAVVVPPDSGNDNYVFSRLRAGKALGEAIAAAINAVEGVGAVTANGVPLVVFNVHVVNKFPPQRAASEERSAYGTEEGRQLANIEPSTAAEAVLSSIIAAIDLRSPQKVNISPADQKLLRAPLSAALAVFREASTFCESSEGYATICNLESQRIYRDGQLHADCKGLVMDSEPPPIRQPRDNLEGLLVDAKRAQKILQDFFVPESSASWGPGKMYANPPGMPMALYAYNPGPKPRDNAMLKAIIRYGPGTGAKRHQHLLDLARMTVVFANCDLLRIGLRMALETFKVLGVRNFFNLPRGRKGVGYVELLVAVDVQDWAKPDGNTIPHVCELRLEEQYHAKARLVAAPHLMDFYAQLRIATADLGLDADSVGYMAHMTLTAPAETHNLRIFRRHLAWCFGSTINGWREVMSGSGALISFDRFMRMCKSLHCREQGARLWMELDPGYGGCISLFELDPDGVVLLGRLLVQLLNVMTGVQELTTGIDAEQLFADLCSLARPERPGLVTPMEFRSVVQHFGFSTTEADRAFQYLDNQSGGRKTHSTGVTVKDIQWLARIPALVNLDAVTLKRAIVLPQQRRGTGDDDDETLLSTPSTTYPKSTDSPEKSVSTQVSPTSTPTRSTEAPKSFRSGMATTKRVGGNAMVRSRSSG